MITSLVAAISIPIFSIFFKSKTEYTYHTKKFDFNLEEHTGEYANAYLVTGLGGYPSKQPWMLLHIACLKNDIRKKPKFLGVGNSLCIGTVWQKDFISMRTTIDSLHMDEKTIRRLTRRGQESACGTSMQVNVGATAFLNVQPNYFDSVNGELGLMIRRPKKTSVYVESFVPIDLLTGDLISMLDTCKDERCQQYLRWFSEEGNLISTWTYEVTGVSVFVETEDTISAGLKAKLQTDLQSSPVNGWLQTSYTYINNRTIKITTHNPFYAVGGIQRVSRVREKK